jgi:hypothetical protein
MTSAMPLSRALFARMLLLLIGCLGTSAGCVTTTHSILPCPMTYSEQEKAILAIAPMGADRETVLRKLADAGIEGSSATTQHIYYCDIWNRPNKERWHLDVALMFDQSGKLYKTQFGQADTGMMPKEAPAPKPAALSSPAQARSRGSLNPTAGVPKVDKSVGTTLGVGSGT